MTSSCPSTGNAGYYGAVAAGFFSVFLIGWQGVQGASADWVYGFLAVFWSLLMMLRLMTLTEVSGARAGNHLAQQIIGAMYRKRDDIRRELLATSLGGSFPAFVIVCFAFAGWMAFQAGWGERSIPSFIAAESFLRESLGAQAAPILSTVAVTLFDLGHLFMALMTLSMMGFVFRSHGVRFSHTRPMMIVLAGYAAAGLIAFSGLEAPAAPSFFASVVERTGAIGAGILVLMLFIPLGFISLTARIDTSDWMIVACAMVTGSALICAVFLPFTPFLGAYMALCWIGVFLGWGACEQTAGNPSLTKQTM